MRGFLRETMEGEGMGPGHWRESGKSDWIGTLTGPICQWNVDSMW